MASSLTNLLYHMVFSTKERVPLIHDDLQVPLYEYIGGILRGQRSTLLEIGGMPDHVHLLVKLKADLAVAAAVRLVKSNSSGWIHESHKSQGLYPDAKGTSRPDLLPRRAREAARKAPYRL